MNRHAANLLEIPRILEQLAGYCLTDAAAAEARDPSYFATVAEVERCLDLVGCWRRVLDTDDPCAGLSFPDTEGIPRVVRVEGAVLEGAQLHAVARVVLSARELQTRLTDRTEAEPLVALLNVDSQLVAAARRIDTCLEADGSVIEKAVPALRELGNRMRGIAKTLQQRAQSYLTDDKLRNAFVSDVPTQKDGRVVLPMRANQRNRVGGVVYDVSQTGSTVYVEPPDILEQNNELRQAQSAYRTEVLRLYRELSGELRAVADELARTIAEVTVVDLLYAKAQYARDHRCTRVTPDPGRVILSGARHPLLGKQCVAMDLVIPQGKRILIITGPNTGGKTVTLKTLGVLAFLFRLGMQLPVAEQSRMPLYNSVLADIGDEQSLEQSLSTFSGHMKNVGQILRESGPDSLVLLDELGAGTDPDEGGALATAVVDRLVELGTTAVITTHHSALKHYGYTHAEVENASVEFDRDELRPTYRLLVGIPGSSHALHIARRHGLPDATVSRAERYLGEQRTDAATIIEELSRRSATLRDAEQEYLHRRETLRSEEEAVASREQKLAGRELEIKREQTAGIERFVSETRRRLENLVRELREGELTRERTGAVKQFLQELGQEAEQERGQVERIAEQLHRATRKDFALEPGARVRIMGSKRQGTALRRVRDGKWQVEVGSMRVTVEERELEVTAEASPEKPEITVDLAAGSSGPAPSFELDVRGMRLEQAVKTVRDQVDRAMQSGMRDFGIIHGLGTGVLQQGVRALLAEYPQIRFEYAKPEEGGFGKTWVHLNVE